MPQRCSVQLLTILPPERHKLIHQTGEAVVVMTLQQMRQLMNNDVLQAMHRLLNQLQIQPDAAGCGVLHVPQRVFIRFTPHSTACTPITASHLAGSSGICCFSCRRYLL